MKIALVAIVVIILISFFVVVALFATGQFDNDNATTPTPVLTPTPTLPSGALILGESGIIPEECYLLNCNGNNDIQFTVTKYEFADCLCGSDCIAADDWRMRVLVYYRAENLGTMPTTVPYLSLFYEGERLPLYDAYDCADYLYPDSYLDPGASTEGWKYNSAVPKTATISQIKVGINHPYSLNNFMKPYWILGGVP